MNLARLSCGPSEGVGICRHRNSNATGVTGHPHRGVQGSVCPTRTWKASCLPSMRYPPRLSCTSSAQKSVLVRRSGSLHKHLIKSTWMPRGLGGNLKPSLHLQLASTSDVSLASRSMDSDDDEEQSLEESTGSNVEDSLSVSGKALVVQPGGKAGFVSFYKPGLEKEQPRSTQSQELEPLNDGSRRGFPLLWLVGPLALVISVVGPPLYLRRVFETFLEDSLLTDFVILFCTEALFYTGVSLFLYICHKQRVLQSPSLAKAYGESVSSPVKYPVGYRVSMIVSLALGVVLPAVSFAVVWPWTGPAAAAALMPYLVGLAVQLAFEKIVRAKKSPVWPLVPITFQVYRLHQLNRAAQLVAGLVFSLKGVEATPETMAINGSLQSLLSVVQLLGILCLWSLGSFLMHHFPSWPQRDQAISVP